ncbi:SIR2 family NAD-dependent protein deacylase [Gracilibacillus salinarum]|uniref:SIR2 family protein n=1 Tax=Gracilibacillus salinarum TaxID=2932255 RepID=A0ABY4GK61_9BACI|nr:SIR2 family protein [Gracilibacillus salinarum]UOQ84657.1 SIR2 family protein [Gracilibacillus salinarum]
MEDTINLFKEKLPKYHHLQKIRDRLWAEDGKSRVSVMIGSGFSLNANKLDASLESMSTWLGVKNKILEGLNPDELPDSENVLDISESYASEYGRESLDTIIKQTVPDQNYEPGEIHRSLLKLPWSDIYTTNYDTLLERTLPHIIERNYQVIYDVRDIPNSASPRIVKLHGSFPSNRPFIFTRSDFESYSRKFAPLVNMVQQSIMETTFVLLGFSGDDPNFESWTKWVNKNLGEHMPKIYMLAYDEHKRESLLKERGITLIDFKEVYKEENKGNVYEQMFNDVFQYLAYQEKKDEREWPYKSYFGSNLKKIDNVLNTFIYNRENYPGWLVMPDIIKKRNIEILQLACNELEELAANSENEISKRISAVNEIVWVYDTFQIPIDYGLHKTMRELIDESTATDYPAGIKGIIVRLLKEARLDYNENDFNKYLEILEKSDLNEDITNQFIFEQILMKIAKFEYNEARSLLDKWSLTNKDFEWMVKKAVIFSRIGEKEKSIKILENNLTTVRKIIAIKNNNYRLLSLEGVILSNLIQLKRNTMQNSKERLLILESKLSNPLKELDFMFSRIKPYEEKSGIFEKKGFDPNRISQTSRFNSTLDLELVDSYSMIMLYEEFGLGSTGQKFAKNAINIALKNAGKLYPFYSWIMYLRIGDVKEIDHYFSRDVIYKTDGTSLSLFAEIVMVGILSNQNTNLLLEVLSRIYFALQKEEKVKVDKTVIELYGNRGYQEENRRSNKKVFEHLFRRILFDKNNDEKGIFISEVYKLPIIGDPQGSLSEIILNDFSFYDPSFEFDFSDNIEIDVDIAEVNRLLKILKGEKSNIRDASLRRLANLLATDNFPDEFIAMFRTNVADIIRKEESNYCNGLLDSYLVLITDDIELQEKYSHLRIQESIPKSHDSKTGITSIGSGLDTLLRDLRNIFPDFIYKENRFLTLTNRTYISWLENFFEWWDNQEEWLLKEKTDSLFGESDDLLIMIIFLKNSFLPNIPVDCLTAGDKEKLEGIYTKLCKNKYHMALFLIPTLVRVGVVKQNSIDKIYDGLMSNNLEIFNSSVVACYDLVILESMGEIIADLSEVKTTLLNLFIYRKEVTLLETTKSISNIIKNIPDFFNNAEYLSLIKSLNLILDDFEHNYYDNSSITDQKNELLSELANLSGKIYANGKVTYNEELESWKTFTKEHRLPEVRKYSELFESK